MRNGFNKNYPGATADDRFKLIFGSAEQHKEKSNQPGKSVTKKIRPATKAALGDRLNKLTDIGKTFFFAWWTAVCNLELADTCSELCLEVIPSFISIYAEGANYGWKLAGKKGSLFSKETPGIDMEILAMEVKKVGEERVKVSRLRANALAEVKAIYMAFEKFCSEIEVDVMEALQLDNLSQRFNLYLPKVLERYPDHEDISTNEILAAQYLSQFRIMWIEA